MTKIITYLTLFVCSLLTAQTNYETQMAKGLALWSQEKNGDAVAIFEQLATAEQDKWLPNYYIALIATLTSFETKDKEKAKSYLDLAQNALDIELVKDAKNADLLVVQGLIYTRTIMIDPMANGMQYSGMAEQVYAKAKSIDPQNPRVLLCKAEFEMGAAQYFGRDTTSLCQEISKTIPLFENFVPKTPFHPTWGLEKAKQIAANCK